MKIVITGGTGFLGRHLSSHLEALGHEIVLIQRSDLREGANRVSKLIKSSEVIINLAGSPVIKRWSKPNRREMQESRLNTTKMMVESSLKLNEAERPSLFISASAIGIYNSHSLHTENSVDFENNFLGELCQQWEACLDPIRNGIVRLCVVRIGIVLGTEGGMLKKVLPLFRFGLGGKIGTGKQGLSFIHHLDFCRAIQHLIENAVCEGIFNLTAPECSSNAEFTKILAQICHRPAVFTVPELALQVLYGQAAVALTEGQQVLPQHLLDAGFKFKFPNLQMALQDLVAR